MRTKPYTEIGVKRVPCLRCGEKASAQWNICALGKSYHAICAKCDLKLNALVLRFARVPNAKQLLAKYKGEKV